MTGETRQTATIINLAEYKEQLAAAERARELREAKRRWRAADPHDSFFARLNYRPDLQNVADRPNLYSWGSLGQDQFVVDWESVYRTHGQDCVVNVADVISFLGDPEQ